jgi:deoxycytidylate deaminase
MLDLPDTKYKHFSFLIRRNKIVSVGYNLSFHTHPIAKKYKYRFSNIHSELAAIKNFPYSPSLLYKYTMVNVRIMGNGCIGLSKPCDKCQQLLLDFDIRKVLYSIHGGDFKKL